MHLLKKNLQHYLGKISKHFLFDFLVTFVNKNFRKGGFFSTFKIKFKRIRATKDNMLCKTHIQIKI